MELVATILEALGKPECDVPSLLRQARMLAGELGNDELGNWASAELNGYGREQAVPDYRKIGAPPLGKFVGSFGASADRVMIPLSNLPEPLRSEAPYLVLRHPIREIAGFVESEKRAAMHVWPADLTILLRKFIRMDGDFVLVEIHQPVTKAAVDGIVDSVRNRLLELMLNLVKLNPGLKKSDKGLAELPPGDVSRAIQVAIYGSGNIVAAGDTVAQDLNFSSITVGNLRALEAALSSRGIEDKDLEELRKSLKAETSPVRGELGPKTRRWMGRMLAKAAEGTWKVAVETAPTLISKALSAYYGWGSSQ